MKKTVLILTLLCGINFAYAGEKAMINCLAGGALVLGGALVVHESRTCLTIGAERRDVTNEMLRIKHLADFSQAINPTEFARMNLVNTANSTFNESANVNGMITALLLKAFASDSSSEGERFKKDFMTAYNVIRKEFDTMRDQFVWNLEDLKKTYQDCGNEISKLFEFAIIKGTSNFGYEFLQQLYLERFRGDLYRDSKYTAFGIFKEYARRRVELFSLVGAGLLKFCFS